MALAPLDPGVLMLRVEKMQLLALLTFTSLIVALIALILI